ncbi:MAG: four helix bundle protein [Planctomycetes bacterium]|nr:four helix bundle protein [Planctomycetota bacterium]
MFRFETLEVWKKSIVLLDKLLDIADELADKNLFRFAEQLRGAGLSIPNNIAEATGCNTRKEITVFLSYAKRSAYEVVSMLVVFVRRKYITVSLKEQLTGELEEVCKMITGFAKSLH